MVVIRLARTGAKKQPFYHVIVADSRYSRDGRFIERLGYSNPKAQGKEVSLMLKRERIEYWLSVGAQPSQRVSYLIKQWDKSAKANAESAA